MKISYGEQKTLIHYRRKLLRKAKSNNYSRPIQDYLLPMINGQKRVDILDVGSGPFSKVGTMCEGVFINVVACDILADEYKQMIEEAKIVLVTPIVKEDMENLSYADNSFDIVHCINALDHTKNPKKALAEMRRVCKCGGWVYLRHYMNSGKRRHYKGMHWWNITESGGFWNKQESFEPIGFSAKVEDKMVVMVVNKNG